MRRTDLIRLALSSLWRQKLRTALTLLGVVIGATTMTMSLSVGRGIERAIDEQFRRNDRLRRIEVFPDFEGEYDQSQIPPEVLQVEGRMSEAKRARIREMLADRWRNRLRPAPPRPLTAEILETIAGLPHVVRVVPHWHMFGGRAVLNDRAAVADVYAVPFDRRGLSDRVEVGSPLSSDTAREALVHEFLLYELGVRDDAEVERVIGKPLRLELENSFELNPEVLLRLFSVQGEVLSRDEADVLDKSMRLLPEALEHLNLPPDEMRTLRELLRRRDPDTPSREQMRVTAEFRIAGVLRGVPRAEREDNPLADGELAHARVVLPLESGAEFFLRLPRVRDGGIHRATVTVDDEGNVRAVNERIKATGVRTFALVEFAEQVKTNVALVSFGMNFIALVALVVAAVGITNTLFTSVLERTQEIGVMKAVGARDGDVQGIFLLEGAVIGLCGGLLGLLAGWLGSLPGDGYARELMAKQTQQPVPETMFVFPWWLLVGVPLFCTLVTTVAALLPARRAARVHPVEALRYE